MKLIEKLAEDWVRSKNIGMEMSGFKSLGEEIRAEGVFMAGFRKAREMAENTILEHGTKMEEYNPFNGSSNKRSFADKVKNLGEEEV